MLTTHGHLYVKDGPLTAPWTGPLDGTVAAVRLSGRRIAVITSEGHLVAKDGDPGGSWIPLAPPAPVRAVAMTQWDLGPSDSFFVVRPGEQVDLTHDLTEEGRLSYALANFSGTDRLDLWWIRRSDKTVVRVDPVLRFDTLTVPRVASRLRAGGADSETTILINVC
jgi:hypothetical protein